MTNIFAVHACAAAKAYGETSFRPRAGTGRTIHEIGRGHDAFAATAFRKCPDDVLSALAGGLDFSATTSTLYVGGRIRLTIAELEGLLIAAEAEAARYKSIYDALLDDEDASDMLENAHDRHAKQQERATRIAILLALAQGARMALCTPLQAAA